MTTFLIGSILGILVGFIVGRIIEDVKLIRNNGLPSEFGFHEHKSREGDRYLAIGLN